LPTAAPVDVAELIGHTYVATDVTENGQPIAIVPETRIALRFIDASHFAASSGCNDIGGDYEIRDGRLKTDNMRSFARLCLGERGQQESMLHVFLQSSPTISRDTTGLVLSTDEVVITFVDEATT
jgi:heat shock protein HslJ